MNFYSNEANGKWQTVFISIKSIACAILLVIPSISNDYILAKQYHLEDEYNSNIVCICRQKRELPHSTFTI